MNATRIKNPRAFPRRPATAALALALALAAALSPALAPRALAASKLNLPPWLAEASKRVTPVTKETVAAVLHDESVITVSPNGRMTKNITSAVRIVTRDGRKAASIVIPYDSSSEKITAFKAWLVRPDGDGKTYTLKDAVDVGIVPGKTVYTEMRAISLSAGDDAYENCIFACEYTEEDRGIFGQDVWQFQSDNPVALSRVTYKLPKDWKITATAVNHAPIAPTVNGNAHTWELRDLPTIANEPLSPSDSRIIPHLNINLFPPPGSRTPPLLSFASWGTVADYVGKLHQKPSQPDPAVTAKAGALLSSAGANASLWERINALARCAQAINYVSIDMNRGRGGGMTPRAASEVLKTGYGDCKDKTVFLRAMLATAGIESYSVVAYSGDRYHVTEDWPTPMQFNHCITAIKITDPTLTSPAIVEHPALGRLLFFDPTDTYTPLGDLDSDTQGSLVLVLAGENGALVRLPYAAPADNRLNRSIDATLNPAGAITVRLKEHSTGQAAALERAYYRGPKNKYDDWNRSWINSSVPASKILKTDATDSQEQGTFDLAIDFSAPNYAKMMRDKLLVFKPAILGRRDFVPLTKPTRVYPVILPPGSYSENAVIAIPDGYTVDELPPPAEETARFGRYKATTTYDAAKRQLRYQREIEMSAAEIPASDYETVRRFFETMRKAEQTPVVLIKQ